MSSDVGRELEKLACAPEETFDEVCVSYHIRAYLYVWNASTLKSSGFLFSDEAFRRNIG